MHTLQKCNLMVYSDYGGMFNNTDVFHHWYNGGSVYDWSMMYYWGMVYNWGMMYNWGVVDNGGVGYCGHWVGYHWVGDWHNWCDHTSVCDRDGSEEDCLQ